MSLGELAVELGVKADTFTVREFSKALGDIPLSVASAITSVAGLSFGFVEMTKNVLDMTSGFRVFTAETGLNTVALQQWQQVLRQSNLDPALATSALTSLSSIMAQMNMGYGLSAKAAQAFGAFHFGTGDFNLSPDAMLEKIQSGAKGMKTSQAAQYLQALGINPEMLVAFQTPASERHRISPTMNSGEIQGMAQFQKDLAEFNNTVLKEFVKVLQEVEPYMGDLTRALTEFVKISGGALSGVLGITHKMMLNHDHKKGLLEDFMPPDRGQWPGRQAASNSTLTQNIYSTSDPMAIADEAARLSKRQNAKVAADLVQQGH